VKFGVRDLPEEVVADTHLAGGADEQIGIRKTGGVEVVGHGAFANLVGLQLARIDLASDLAHGIDDFSSRAIVDRETEGGTGVGRGQSHELVGGFEHFGGKSVTTADLDETDVLSTNLVGFAIEISGVEVHQGGDLVGRSLPVVERERVERQALDTQVATFFNDGPNNRCAVAMAKDARESAVQGPSTVAIHNDGDVAGNASGVNIGETTDRIGVGRAATHRLDNAQGLGIA